jgi:16S rRNA (cytidine1402-2'-O)-methyltransferase
MTSPGRPDGESRTTPRRGSPAGGTLYLMPVPIADDTAIGVLPPSTLAVARRLDLFFAESAKTARAHLKALGHPRPLAELEIVEIGHRPHPAAIDGWLRRLADGRDAAVLSEAGCPGIADPGADLAARAHALGLRVQPLVGPSAILLALMAGGLNGQSFRFLGYLPQEATELAARLRDIDLASRAGETQVWIETPYRNERMLSAVLTACAPDTLLSLAIELTAGSESVHTHTIAAWKALPPAARPALNRRPAVFSLLAGRRAGAYSRSPSGSGRGGSR